MGKSISIEVINRLRIPRSGIPYYKGKIRIGNYCESLYIAVDYWTLDQYKQQWKEGLERIKTHDTSMLVTNIRNPDRIPTLLSPSFERWALYKVGEKIIVQPAIIFNPFFDTLPYKGPFTLESCYEFITPRSLDKRADQWIINMADL